jgi:flagellar biosynthesis protein FlhF
VSVTSGESKVYRGSSLEEILPRIREELGPDAVILREREGLVGGIGGFFARRCIEVEAAPGWPHPEPDPTPALPPREAAELYAAAEEEPSLERPENRFMESLLDRAAALDELFVPTHPPQAKPPAPRQAPPATPAATPTPPVAAPMDDLFDAAAAPFEQTLEAAEAALPEPPPVTTARSSRRKVKAPPKARAAVRPTEESPGEPDDPAKAAIRTEAAVRVSLARAGMGGSAIEELLDRVHRHLTPLAPTTSIAELTRLALRSALTTPLGWVGTRTIGFAALEDAPGPETVAGIAAAHATTGARVAVIALGGGRPAAQLAAHLLDSPVDLLLVTDIRDVARITAETADADLVLALSSPISFDDDRTTLASAALLVAMDADESHLILPVGCPPVPTRRILDALDAFVHIDCLLPTSSGLAEEIGGTVGVAFERQLALRWVASMAGTTVRVHPADPATLAEAIVL